MLATSTSTRVRVRVRASSVLYHGTSDPSLATGRSTHLLFYDTIVRAWITQSGDMETRGRNERGRASRLSEAHAALMRSCAIYHTYMCYPFTTLTRTSPHASCRRPILGHFGGERGATLLSPSRVCASRQAQGRAARVSEHRTSFQSPFIYTVYSTRTSWPHPRIYARVNV